MKSKLLHLSLFLCGLAIVPSTARSQVSSADYAPCQEMPHLMTMYEADLHSLSRYYTTPGNSSGFGGYEGGESGGDSPEKRARIEALCRDYLKRLGQLDFQGLSQECKVDYILFRRDLEARLQVSARDEAGFAKIKKYFPFSDSIYVLEKMRRRGHAPVAEMTAKSWADDAEEIRQLKNKLKSDSTLGMDEIYQAGLVVKDLKRALAAVYNFFNGYDPLFTWWMPKPYKELDDALTAYGEAFTERNKAFMPSDNSGIVGKPAGREELLRQLKYEMIPYSPEELVEIANKEFAWCDAEMLKASKELGFGDNWKAALEKVKNTFVPPGKQPGMILDLFRQSVDFLKKHDLVTVPPVAEETFGMMMMTPERQLVNPFFLGGNDIIISYPTNTMEENDRLMSMRGNNPHFSRATVHHELIAGHNLEAYYNARYRTYRNFDTPFWVEGWSLYWELLLWDLKFPRGPEDRVGMLFWHMHRCARIIFSLNYHLGKWTPQQCIDFLVDRVGHERANAAGEVRRSFVGHYPPLYQLAYLTGGRQFYALKKELVDGGKMTYRQYHDAVMQLNSMPVEMVRAILTKQPLQKDFSTQWRFYDLGGVK